MERVLEPELMTDGDQAAAYASVDFSESHNQFIALYRHCFPEGPFSGNALEIGCGTGDILFRFAREYSVFELVGVDGSKEMLVEAEKLLSTKPPAIQSRVKLLFGYVPEVKLPLSYYDVVLCNGTLHHFPDPLLFWRYLRKVGRNGSSVLVRDLIRPESEIAASMIVKEKTAGLNDLFKRDFYNSLLASFSIEEIKVQLAAAELQLVVEQVGEQHFLVWGRL